MTNFYIGILVYFYPVTHCLNSILFVCFYRSITGNKPIYLFKYVLTCISPLNGFGEISLCYIIIPLRVLYIVYLLQRHCNYSLTCLPDETFLDWSKLVAFVDDKVNETQNM